MKIIDSHVHDIDLFRKTKEDPKKVAKLLLDLMDEMDIEHVIMFAVDVDLNFPVTKEECIQGLQEMILYKLPSILMKGLEDFEDFKKEHIDILKKVRTPTKRVLEISKYGNGRIHPVASLNPKISREDARREIKKIKNSGILGVKLYPTLQFFDPSSYKLDNFFDILEREEMFLFVHTGCDPGIWELPYFCQNANPSKFEHVIEKHQNLRTVLCHMGAYSAMKPGIFFNEAMNIAKKYDNVYLDTAAVDPYFIKLSIEKIGDEKILFGSDFPAVSDARWEELVDVVRYLDIEKSLKNKIMYENAKKLFDL